MSESKTQVNICTIGPDRRGDRLSRLPWPVSSEEQLPLHHLPPTIKSRPRVRRLSNSSMRAELTPNTTPPSDNKSVEKMLKTPNKMHGAILVTDSFGSVNDQMQEHCALAHAARVDGVVVFLNINKSYGLEEDEDTTKNLKRDIREFLYKVGFGGKGVPISHGSALEALEGKGEGVAGICEPASDLHAWIRENPMQSINSAMY